MSKHCTLIRCNTLSYVIDVYYCNQYYYNVYYCDLVTRRSANVFQNRKVQRKATKHTNVGRHVSPCINFFRYRLIVDEVKIGQ